MIIVFGWIIILTNVWMYTVSNLEINEAKKYVKEYNLFLFIYLEI